MIRAGFLLGFVAILVASARSFLPNETSLVGSGAALAFGFILLAALQMGTIFAGLGLPRLTGYLACGFLAGPGVLNMVTERMLADVRLVNGVAIGLIALRAGGELNFKKLRGRLSAIVWAGTGALFAAILALSIAGFLLSPLYPFMEGMSAVQRGVVAFTMAVVFSTLSPTVVIAIISETGATGPVSEIVLGIVVLADLVAIVMFAGSNALAGAVFGHGEGAGLTALGVHLFGSMGCGVLLGMLAALYVRRVKTRVGLFIVAMCFLAAEAGTRLHLDPLLICLSAGIFLENRTDIEGAQLVTETQTASLLVFAVFFAVAGAGLHWSQLKGLVHVSLLLVGLRALFLTLGARLGGMLSGLALEQRREIPYGLISQSGISIGLCTLVARYFPGWGEGASACLLGGVMINEMVGPVLFRNSLVRVGEVSTKGGLAAEH